MSKENASSSSSSSYPCFYYTPQGLVASYQKLKQEEKEKLKRQPQKEQVDDDEFIRLSSSSSSAARVNKRKDAKDGFLSSSSNRKLVVAAVQLTTPPTIAVADHYNYNSHSSSNIMAKGTSSSSVVDDEQHYDNHSDIAPFWIAAQEAVEQAAQRGATVILLPELFLGPYFCQTQEYSLMIHLAETIIPHNKKMDEDGNDTNKKRNEDDENFVLCRMQAMARQYQVVLVISLYEKQHAMRYNSVVVIDADGSMVGTNNNNNNTYRKSHIPDGPGYQEKFYFSPGDSGFRVFSTRYGMIGVAICWDQWFPEVARILALQGAQVILYPTAIGSEPCDDSSLPTTSSADHWQRVMQGHAAANMIPVVAANRFGTEVLLQNQHRDHDHDDDTTSLVLTERQRIHFYGRSFITDETGAIVQQAKDGADIIVAEINVQQQEQRRTAWGLFRDRRPDLYGLLLTKDGRA